VRPDRQPNLYGIEVTFIEATQPIPAGNQHYRLRRGAIQIE
jgi:hypothetical protein